MKITFELDDRCLLIDAEYLLRKAKQAAEEYQRDDLSQVLEALEDVVRGVWSHECSLAHHDRPLAANGAVTLRRARQLIAMLESYFPDES